MLIGAARHIVEDCLSLSHTHAEETGKILGASFKPVVQLVGSTPIGTVTY